MAAKSEVLQYLGPLVNYLYMADLCDFAERVWDAYRGHAGDQGAVKYGSREYLIVRMMYIAEVTSNAIRLNATWSLTPAAMSLLRDRYEQAVRFSWLVRNPNPEEYLKYERHMFAKLNKLVKNLSPDTIEHFAEKMGPLADWVTEALTKEQAAYLAAWETLDLRSMAQKRDAFPPIGDTPLAKMELARWYDAIYSQFSSVSHYDRFSIEMVKPQPNEDGSVSLCLESHWPYALIFQTAYFDMIQCSEAVQVCFEQDVSAEFDGLFAEWRGFSDKLSSGGRT